MSDYADIDTFEITELSFCEDFVNSKDLLKLISKADIIRYLLETMSPEQIIKELAEGLK